METENSVITEELEAVADMTPKRKIDLWKKDESNKEYPIIVMGYGTWIKLNTVAAKIWERCIGEGTVAEMIEQLSKEYPNVEKDKIRNDVISFLKEFDSKGLIVMNYDPLAF